MFQEARTLGAQTGVPAAAFYALGRSGTGPALQDMVDVSVDELRTSLSEAVADGIVASVSFGEVDAIVEHLANQIVEHALRPNRPGRSASLADVLVAADIPTESIARVLRRYQTRSGTTSEFWDSYAELEDAAEATPDSKPGDIEIAVRLASLIGAHP